MPDQLRMNPSYHFRAIFVLFCLIALVRLAAEETEIGHIHLKLTGSAVFGAGVDVAVKDAALFLDSTNFDGKSGFVRLQKGMTAAYLVLATRAVSGEIEGTFDKKPFLQRNVTPLPKLPMLAAPEDWVILIGVLDVYNPRKQETSTLQQVMARQPITKLTSMAPWISTVKVPSVVIDTIQFHIVDAVARTPSAPGKEYSNNASPFRNDGTVIVYGPGEGSLHLQCKQDRPPFDPAPVVLRRAGDGWTATLDLKSKEIEFRGTLPVRFMPPVARIINEYAGNK